MAQRTILLVGAGTESVPAYVRARELGLRVVGLDGDPEAPGFAHADAALVTSTYDEEGAVDAARRWADAHGGLQGVLSVAVDVPRTVARLAAAFGLPGPSLETAALCSDKLAMKERLAQAGVRVPWFAEARSAQALEPELARRGALVIKPVDSRGARGVSLVREARALGVACERAWAVSPSGRALAEEYLPGPQVSSEGLFVGGRAHTPGFSDRNYARLEEFAPDFIEDGGTLPSALGSKVRAALLDVHEQAGAALGVVDGPCKGDLVHSGGRAQVIEMAPRLSGGWFCTHQIPWSSGVDLLGLALLQALGERPSADDLRPTRARGVATRYVFPPPGVLRAVHGLERARALPGVEHLVLFVRPGQRLEPVSDHTRRAGCVIACADSREEAIARAEAARDALEFELE